MPCDTIRTVTVDLNVADESVLVRALSAAGFEVDRLRPGHLNLVRRNQVSGEVNYATIRGGKIEVQQNWNMKEGAAERAAGEIKRAYANEAVRTAAKKYGWAVQQDRKDTNHVTLQKRSY